MCFVFDHPELYIHIPLSKKQEGLIYLHTLSEVAARSVFHYVIVKGTVYV